MADRSIHPSLKGRVVLVTGGATGIGAAHVCEFAAHASRVAFLDIAADAGERLATRVAAEGAPRPLFRPTDLTNLEDLDAAIADVTAELGDISVLVNNAANDQRHALDDVTEETFDANVAVNLRHLLFAAKAVVPGMRRLGGGVILNTGSMSWRAAFPGLPLYLMAKAGIEGLTRALASELGPHNIRVNTIIPGWVMTERQLALWVDDAARRKIAENQCLPGTVEPVDIARMATFLASDDSRMCTNQSFVVDGGWL